MKRKVSVVIPVYNEIRTIEKLIIRLSDALSTTKHDFELIFVDDHSTDGTFEYLHRYIGSENIKVLSKKGKKGKAYSLLEGFEIATGDMFAMIDADLQYPPEEILPMLQKLEKADVVVANRKKYQDTTLRKTLSRGFRYIFGKMLFGLNVDVQSGLKVFTAQAYHAAKFLPKASWTFDLEFLHRAVQTGHKVTSHDITFIKRKDGNSKLGVLGTTFQIGLHALQLRSKPLGPIQIAPVNGTMVGAGVGYKKKKYITHTTLPHHRSALQTFTFMDKVVIFGLIALLGLGFAFNALQTTLVIVAVLSAIYFIDVLFNLYVIMKSLYIPQEITFEKNDLYAITDEELPVYSILCPLYKEAHVVPQFLDAISKLYYPKHKLDVMLLLEEDDLDTILAVNEMRLPSYVRTVIVPDSEPKTKPKACNYGLLFAKGEYVVIFDAEDVPDPMQLKKAYLGFKKLPKDVICLQAKLNYYNPNQNLLTRFFTAEYSLWFDITLPGLQSLRTSLPLGGTSNHFRKADLLSLQGWDPFNVTEDADLGIRLFDAGFKTAIINSTTLEEANSRVGNWLRQRSRWLKGYMQTYLVHTKNTLSFAKKRGYHALIFQLIVGGKIAFILINPLLWAATISYFMLYEIVGPTIETLYPSYVFYMAGISLIFGNFLFLFYYMIGAYKRGQYTLIKFVYLIPLYWILLSIACGVAFFELLFKPHYWQKTVHGFHLSNIEKKKIAKAVVAAEETQETVFPQPVQKQVVSKLSLRKSLSGGVFLIVATVIGNILNLLFSTYFGRVLSPSDFGLLSLIRSFWFFASIPFAAVGLTTNSRSGFIAGRYGNNASHHFWKYMSGRSMILAFAISLLWIGISPFLKGYFHADSLVPFLVFSPIWLVGFAYFIDRGYISGRFLFGWLAVLTVFEAVIKLGLGVLVFSFDPTFVYTAIPASFVIAFIFGWIVLSLKKSTPIEASVEKEVKRFPKKFFIVSSLSGLSTLSFLSLDIMLAKHYLSPVDAGYYGLLALIGSMVFFMGTLASQFLVPLVSREEGQKKSSSRTLMLVLLATAALSFGGFLVFGVFAKYTLTLPFLLGQSVVPVLSLAPFFAFAMFCFVLARVFVTYYLTRQVYTFPLTAFILSIVQILLVEFFHDGLESFVIVMLVMGGLNFILMVIFHVSINAVKTFEQNIKDLFAVFSVNLPKEDGKLNILILNWRDKRHVWAGGAEVYVHELATRWVNAGCNVTIFCGNDRKSPKNQTVDGVRIVRRGGTYSVYLWAMLYYLFRFQGKFDVIIDCENGIPFFSPLYARVPVFLLIHHVHQEVFQQHLMFPFSVIAKFLEGSIMPFVYKDKQVVTVSESSKNAIVREGIAKAKNISIITNGIDVTKFQVYKKTHYPLFTYLGRLKAYKNIDITMYAFAKLLKEYPTAQLAIVGTGESGSKLIKLSRKLGIEKNVSFYGQVDEKTKRLILGKTWACLQPSMMEGFGITVIEANAAGTPVIASNVPGLMDAVVHRKTGFLVELRNPEKMYKVMSEIAGNQKTRERLSESARIWAGNFNWDESAREFLMLISRSVDRKYRGIISGAIAFIKE